MSNIELTRTEAAEPDLAVTLEAAPPIANPGGSYEWREDWTLDNLERTLLEFRAAGAWDGSVVKFSSKAVSCEVLTGRGPDALPWGWVPRHGDPKEALKDRRLDSLPWFDIVTVALLVVILIVAVTS